MPLPLPLGWDVAGTVVELGEGVYSHAVGDQVVGMIDAAAVVAAPTTVRLADAALPLAGLTAWQVIEGAELAPGERVLVNGADGGIGGFVTQLAHHAGTQVIATASPRSRRAVLRQGADQVIDYTTTRLRDAVAGGVDPGAAWNRYRSRYHPNANAPCHDREASSPPTISPRPREPRAGISGATTSVFPRGWFRHGAGNDVVG